MILLEPSPGTPTPPVDPCVPPKLSFSESPWTMLMSSYRLRSLAPAIQGYWRATITALGLLARVQLCFSKLLLRQYTPSLFCPLWQARHPADPPAHRPAGHRGGHHCRKEVTHRYHCRRN